MYHSRVHVGFFAPLCDAASTQASTAWLSKDCLDFLFGLPPLLEMEGQAHLAEQSIQMVFADLDGTKGRIPLAVLARSGDGLHIFDHGRVYRQNGTQLFHDPRLGFPAAASRGRYPLLAVEPIIEAFGASPLARASCSPHSTSSLHGLFDVIGCLHHEVHHRVTGPDDAEPLERTARINPHGKGLVIRLLLVA